jgi:hypothetical protein
MLNLHNGSLRKNGEFQYIKMNTAFDPDTYKQLNNTFPQLDCVIKSNGCKGLKFSNRNRFDLDIAFLQQNTHLLSEEWKDCIQSITCESFFREACNLLNIEHEKYTTFSFRKDDDNQNSDIKIDFQICYNLKNSNDQKEFLRKPHIDAQDKLLVVLIYFPYLSSEYADQNMGNLCLYDKTGENIIDDVKYKHNHGILFKNNEHAIHAPYTLLHHPDENRRFINIVFIDNTL